jgi:hypothetical protein
MRALRRIRYPSVRAPRPQGVFTMRSTPPASIIPSTSPPSSPILGTTVTGSPLFLSTSAVPSLAAISNPRSANARAMSTTARLSLLATETYTLPATGSACPAAVSALANAPPNVLSIPIASPVERISGPSSGSTSAKRSNGNTGALTEKWPFVVRWSPMSRSFSPSSTLVATFASGTPVALEMNGTVREARGLHSMTSTSSPRTTNCTFIRPTTPTASARRLV